MKTYLVIKDGIVINRIVLDNESDVSFVNGETLMLQPVDADGNLVFIDYGTSVSEIPNV